MSKQIEQTLDRYRDGRDRLIELMFKAIYESPWLAAAIGIQPKRRDVARRHLVDLGAGAAQAAQAEEVETFIDEGSLLDAWARLLIYVRPRGEPVDERPFNMVRRMIEEMKPEILPSFAALKAAIKRQAYALAFDEERALAALPKLAPDIDNRRRGLRRRVVSDARARRADARPERALPPRRERARARRGGGA